MDRVESSKPRLGSYTNPSVSKQAGTPGYKITCSSFTLRAGHTSPKRERGFDDDGPRIGDFDSGRKFLAHASGLCASEVVTERGSLHIFQILAHEVAAAASPESQKLLLRMRALLLTILP